MKNIRATDHPNLDLSCGIPSIYPVALTVKSADGGGQGMGRTLNISKTGIIVETCFPVETGQTLSISMALENALIDLEGQVVACRKGSANQYETGIRFMHCEHFSYDILEKYVDRFNNLRQTEEYA